MLVKGYNMQASTLPLAEAYGRGAVRGNGALSSCPNETVVTASHIL